MTNPYKTLRTHTFECAGAEWVVEYFSDTAIEVTSPGPGGEEVFVPVCLKDGKWDFESPGWTRLSIARSMDEDVADELLEFFNEHGTPGKAGE